MRDYSKPPYDLGEIGRAVKSLGEHLDVPCNLCVPQFLKSQGFFSLPTLSEDIVRIAAKYGIQMTVTGDLEQTARQLQSLIVALSSKGIG